MIREIIHDPVFLAQPSAAATEADVPVAADLIDTLKANLDRCVGMAANMIGQKKRIIAVAKGPMIVPMLNPKILSKAGEYETEEGCLSLQGTRKTKRYRTIRLQWQDMQMKTHVAMLDGFETIRACVAYEKDGVRVTDMPYDTEGWTAVYQDLPGWQEDLSQMTSENQFPKAFADYIKFLEDELQTPITILSVGPDREQTIIRG